MRIPQKKQIMIRGSLSFHQKENFNPKLVDVQQGSQT